MLLRSHAIKAEEKAIATLARSAKSHLVIQRQLPLKAVDLPTDYLNAKFA